jgi:hypothetical protein
LGSGAGESLRAVAFLSPFGMPGRRSEPSASALREAGLELNVQRYRRGVRARIVRCVMTVIRISDSTLLATMLADLGDRPDVVTTPISETSVRVSILGSYNHEAQRIAAYLRIRAWEAAQHARGVDVRVELE